MFSLPEATMIRISQKSLNIDSLNDLYSALEEEPVTIKRLFDSRFSRSGDDLVIEGDIDKVLEKLTQDLPRIISIRFKTNDLNMILESKSVLNIEHGDTKIFFGTTLVDYEHLYSRLRINDKTKILSLLFRSQLGGQFIPLMPVKIKGVVVTNRINSSVEFILPSQRIVTLRNWLEALETNSNVNFDTLVDIFRITDPSMRKKMEDAMNWINLQLPEIVAKSSVIENIDIVRAFQSTLNLM
ncbi:MAG: hypothetical protein KAU62_14905 [Candidatus Heimdallarchaeota archaeon]|nr:hypothetical protein [Candidatus Heimdallarchaeota archaeon]MCG3257389.1 hypothetical protein [Candidatus Heimdallarchaeota archaeon]MCK4612442.1 hypothetical protein [Candidatus Heimdallarchaeota archaeon]